MRTGHEHRRSTLGLLSFACLGGLALAPSPALAQALEQSDPRCMDANQRVLATLYHDLLGRNGTKGEISGWAEEADRLSVAPGQFAGFIVASPEYKARQIKLLYEELLLAQFTKAAGDLGWNPDDPMIESWVQWMESSGATLERVVWGLTGTDSYFLGALENRADVCAGSLKNHGGVDDCKKGSPEECALGAAHWIPGSGQPWPGTVATGLVLVPGRHYSTGCPADTLGVTKDSPHRGDVICEEKAVVSLVAVGAQGSGDTEGTAP